MGGRGRCGIGALGAILVVTASFAGGCAANAPVGPDGFPVSSAPPGATVFAAGKDVGVTPLVVRQKDVFPTTFAQGAENTYGTIVFRKEGCRDNTVRVNTAVVAKGVHVTLDCGQLELAAPPAAGPGASPPTARDRLLRLKELRDQGLITEEEYGELRRRILDTL